MRKFVITIVIVCVFIGSSLFIKYGQKPKTVNTQTESVSQSSTSSTSTSSGSQGSVATTNYQSGTYTGSVANAFYGNVQVSVGISAGKITSVNFLQYPNDNQTSVGINQQAIPTLQQEAIQAQSAHVNIVTGATFTSQAFMQSLAAALAKA